MKSISLNENEINHIKEMYSQELERLQKRSSEISAFIKKLDDHNVIDNQIVEKKPTKRKEKIVEKPTKALKAGNKPKQSTKNAKVEAIAIPILAEKPKSKRGRPAKKTEVKNVTSVVKKVVTSEPKAKRGRKPEAKKLVSAQPAITKKAAKATKKPKVEKLAKPAKIKKEVAKASKPLKPGRKKSEKPKKSNWTASILEILEKRGKVLSSKEILDQIMLNQKIADADRAKTRSIITGSLSDLKLETKRIKSLAVPGQKGELYGLSLWYDENGNLLEQFKN